MNFFQQQIRKNCEAKKHQLERELRMDQIINEQVRCELLRKQKAEQEEREKFRREVFGYLDHYLANRRHNEQVEREKEKLIEDIHVKAAEDSWKRRCEAYQKRLKVNEIARRGQVDQIKKNEELMMREALKEKEENLAFNEREMMEHRKIKEAQWQQRLKGYHYGRELMEQQKAEELKNKAEKQSLEEELMLVAKERERCEKMGKEFVKSYQDVLPLHPNLIIIQKGKKN